MHRGLGGHGTCSRIVKGVGGGKIQNWGIWSNASSGMVPFFTIDRSTEEKKREGAGVDEGAHKASGCNTADASKKSGVKNRGIGGVAQTDQQAPWRKGGRTADWKKG